MVQYVDFGSELFKKLIIMISCSTYPKISFEFRENFEKIQFRVSRNFRVNTKTKIFAATLTRNIKHSRSTHSNSTLWLPHPQATATSSTLMRSTTSFAL